MRALLLLALFVLSIKSSAQWQLIDAHTTADLRGIDSLSEGVAWASGTGGTVLRSEDGGLMWQVCAIPPGAEHLDFRGVRAFDNNIAMVMSSGKGDLSRLYETIDGCQTWKLVFRNPDADGFWDALYVTPDHHTVFLLGDPVEGHFRLFSAAIDTHSGELQKFSAAAGANLLIADTGESAFAASNSLVQDVGEKMLAFISGGSRSEIRYVRSNASQSAAPPRAAGSLPFAACESCGAFSIAAGPFEPARKITPIVVVGGDYQKPDSSAQTAAYGLAGASSFQPSAKPPHGYRSAVAYLATAKAWITVGPNGTDVSTDDGRTWRPLQPGPGDATDADQHWNALSLPYAVGPHGRIGILQTAMLPAAAPGSTDK